MARRCSAALAGPHQRSVAVAPTYNNKIGDVLNRSGVNVKIAGKTDWTSGAHAPWNWLQFWTMYTPFPYNASEGGLNEQPEAVADSGAVCDAAGDVQPGHYSHEGDWTVVNSTTQWIKDVAGPAAKGGTPFFAYQVSSGPSSTVHCR